MAEIGPGLRNEPVRLPPGALTKARDELLVTTELEFVNEPPEPLEQKHIEGHFA